jgi:enamine deaminase RidA (YjgF/YER057c/UK114 family)
VNEVVTGGASLAALPKNNAPAVVASGQKILVLSGQIALADDGTVIGEGDVREQARECFRRIDRLLTAAGAARTDVVRLGVFLVNVDDRALYSEARAEFFPKEHRAAATLVGGVDLIDPRLLVEIEATAVF